MQQKKQISWFWVILFSYILCFIFRFIEYLVIRTDQSVIGEAFLHKLAGIAVMAGTLKYSQYKWPEIGFKRPEAVRHTLWGLLLGGGVFTAAYGAEYVIQLIAGNRPAFAFYISSYSLTGNQVMENSILFLIICIAGNLINVVMEEGLFRGLFIKLGERRLKWFPAMMLAALLFGIWHIAAPVRSFLDGRMSLQSMLLASMVQILLTGLMGIKLGIMVKITGTLWAGMADHFLNNFIINVLHVVTAAGADEMQMFRISAAQTISFIVVLLWYRSAKKAISMKTLNKT